jgi:hypothetical protein
MTFDQVRLFFSVLDLRERVIAGLAIITGMRPGEIFALRRSRLETEQEIDSYQRPWAAPGRGLTVHVEIKVTKCSFPAPGRYRFSLSLDGEELAYRFLDIYLRRLN